MANARPQLNLSELHQLRWLLGQAVALTSMAAVWYLDVEASLLLFAAMLSCIAALLWPERVSRVPAVVHKLAFPISLSVFAFDLYTFGQFLPALVRLTVLLLWYRCSTYRKRRDDLQLILLCLFLVVTAGVLTVSIAFGVQIILFVALSLGLLFVRTLIDVSDAAGEGDRSQVSQAPEWAQVRWALLLTRVRQSMDWRVWVFSVVLFVGLVVFSALLFLVIPRFQIESSLFLDRWINRGSVSGFTDTLRFGDVSDIQKDDSVVIRVDVSDPNEVPADTYWRMTVMDEYRDRSFRMSANLKQLMFTPENTRSQITGFGGAASYGRASWTFYVEPGVSRYMPLLGSFKSLRFTEPQTLRVSERLRILVLSRDPATMKAYRVDLMATGPVLEPTYFNAQREALSLLPTYTEVPFSELERAQLAAAVAEIAPTGRIGAEEFARRATEWLQARHAYALSNTLPPGEGDPLLRWLFSKEPGHCELFAASFTMLARTAGFPTRVVGGFQGATWNQDYLNIRNSNAHAWCEIFLGDGRWLRVDPTASATDTALAELRQSGTGRGSLPVDKGWRAQVDRLKMLWYRRVVRFEQQDQVNLARKLKEKTLTSTRSFRDWFNGAKSTLSRLLPQPWKGAGPTQNIVGAIALLSIAAATWLAVRFGWAILRNRRGSKLEPVRAEAGRLLRLFDQHRRDQAGSSFDADWGESEAELQRLRFGRRETWPNPQEVFRRAKRVLRSARRKSPVASAR